MSDQAPLGDFSEFVRWSGHPRDWGPDNHWKVWFGGQVTDALGSLLGEHLEWVKDRFRASPAVLGAVPWLDDKDLADRIAARAACVVVTKLQLKGTRPAEIAQGLEANGRGLPARAFHQFAQLGQLDEEGKPPVVGPYGPDPLENLVLGPIRVAGYGAGRKKPLPHLKMMVLGEIVWHDEGPLGHVEDVLFFRPWRTWLSSANWTGGSQKHLEFGLWSDDVKLNEHAANFLCALIRFSEPLGAATPDPTPTLADVEYDDEAMFEALAGDAEADDDSLG